MNYLVIIRYSIIFFPIVAFLFTTPFLLIEYHKYGSISLYRFLLTYAFVFYLICAYFLVILPLPKISEVAIMTSPRTQLIPFHFIIDFIKNSSFNLFSFSTYLTTVKESYFYVPLFNILLTIPFGMFLRYYFKCSKRKTILFSFFLSLFFELTQLTGLYFIYPRGYRLFDVDDLLLNTSGGFFGFLLSKPLMLILPKIEEVNKKAKENGKTISGLRRTITHLLDLFILLIIVMWINNIYISYLIITIYSLFIPCLFNNSTLAEKFLNIKVVDYYGNTNKKRLILRRILFILIYFIFPCVSSSIIFNIKDNYIREFLGIIMIVFFLIFYFVTMIKYIFTNKEMLYEKLSKTRLESTIK